MLCANIKFHYFISKIICKSINSFSELLKLLLPEIIVEYFELTSYKKAEEILHLYLKKINSIPKEYRQIN